MLDTRTLGWALCLGIRPGCWVLSGPELRRRCAMEMQSPQGRDVERARREAREFDLKGSVRKSNMGSLSRERKGMAW